MASLNKKYRTLKDISLDVREKILEDYKSGTNSRGKRYSLTDLEIKYHISKSSINKILHQMQDSGNYEFEWRGSPIKKPSKLEVKTYEPKHPKLNFLERVVAGIVVASSILTPTPLLDYQLSKNNYKNQALVYNQEQVANQSSIIEPQLSERKEEPTAEQKVEYPVKTKKVKPTAVFASLNFGVRIALSSFNTLEGKLSRFKRYSKEYYEEVARNLPNGLNEGARYDEDHRAIVLEGGLAVSPNADFRNMYKIDKPEIAKTHLSENEIRIQYDMGDLATKLFFFREETIRESNLTMSQLAELDNKISHPDFNPIKLDYEIAVARMEERGLNLF